MHMSLHDLVNPGLPDTIVLGLPGIHGEGVLGMHGIGVKAPMAADVADATTGLASDWHIPKGKILTMGLLSIMVAMGLPQSNILQTGKTISVDGASPILHRITALLQTNSAIISLFSPYPRPVRAGHHH
jgi:hypothetical protein